MQRLTSSCCTRLSSFCCTRLSSSQCKLLLCLFLPSSCTEWNGPAQVEEINDQRWSSQLNWYLLQSLATCLWSTEATSLSVTWICNEPWEWGRWGSSCSSQKTSEDQCVILRARFGRCSDEWRSVCAIASSLWPLFWWVKISVCYCKLALAAVLMSEDQCVLLRAHFGRCSDLITFGTDIIRTLPQLRSLLLAQSGGYSETL